MLREKRTLLPCGLQGRGRPGYAWDWHANVGFSVGYLPAEREKLVDLFMEDFAGIFGQYPKSVGSWLIDAHTLAYLHDRYGIEASCNCKDQWGTDGYTMWGGYNFQAYYPSRKNVFSPAQSESCQIDVPVFRMLGSDPIYQYDAGLADASRMQASESQPVVTLEPVYKEGGGSPEWVRWFFRETFNGLCLSFGYAQVGQENSFGWKAMEAGLTDQMRLIAQMEEAGNLRVETLGNSGKWYRENYKLTPASAVAALSDWKGEGRKSVWYNNRFYRMNLYQEGNHAWVRDLQIFDEGYEERYLNDACKEEFLAYDNLPAVDGNRWSSGMARAGLYPVQILPDGEAIPLMFGRPVVKECQDDDLHVAWHLPDGGVFSIRCALDGIHVRLSDCVDDVNWGMLLRWSLEAVMPIECVSADAVRYGHNGRSYGLNAVTGRFSQSEARNEILLSPDEDDILITPALG